jgi:hypothetical protein
MRNRHLLLGVLAAIGAAGTTTAQTIVHISSDISTSTVWTANNVYDLDTQIYVLPGATLTIQAGTVIATSTQVGGTGPGSGGVSVTRGAQIFVQGTEENPVIFTSANDRATWTANNPKTGTWRATCGEWGTLTIQGFGYISANNHGGATTNVPTPNANNTAVMEGLLQAFPGDTRVLYGGGNDDDDSGSLSYISLRYGGKVIGFNNELNGLSMGGIGRGTDVHHVEIMNNVDDGIETWGGTVNYKNCLIFNAGDDSFDTDEGWRGKLQFGFFVQGASDYGSTGGPGSRASDHGFEMDGAEDSDWQPVSTNVVWNCTVVGDPFVGRAFTAWRDGNRTQFHNCIFMDSGGLVVKNDGSDGDGAHGYGFNGTLTFNQIWSTPYTTYSTVNAPPNPAPFYPTQTEGMLAEFKDCVFFNNVNITPGVDSYSTFNSVGQNNPAYNNVIEPATRPITSITRFPPVTIPHGEIYANVSFIDPRPQGDALTSVGFAPRDGFFSQAHYRGAFAPNCNLWTKGWTAAEAFGFLPSENWGDVGKSMGGTNGDPVLTGTGSLAPFSTMTLSLANAAPSSLTVLALGFTRIDLPLFGGTVVPNWNTLGTVILFSDPTGHLTISIPSLPSGFTSGTRIYGHWWVLDAGGPQGFAASNAVYGVFP